MQEKVETWKKENPEGSFYFRPSSIVGDKEVDFLYVHQEKWQKDLLQRYGKDIIFLDATNRTTKYALPLFILAVETNSGYFPVAEFIVYSESQERISEALKIIKSWGLNWDVTYGMTDYSEAEISALEAVFPGIIVYICEFHREQAWGRWVMKAENGLNKPEQDEFMSHMRSIAHSHTWEDLCKRIKELKNDVLWQKETVKNYVSRYWFPILRRWVKFYRNPLVDRSVNTNNGVESLNKVLKHNYLKYFCDRTVTGLTTMLNTIFLPERYQKYVKTNYKMASDLTSYNSNVPSYLYDRPHDFVKHVLIKMSVARTIEKNQIRCLDIMRGLFRFKSQTPGSIEIYNIDLSLPTCECYDFRRTVWPCKHILAIFVHYDNWNWQKLPKSYTDSPFFTIDRAVVPSSKIAVNHQEEISEEREENVKTEMSSASEDEESQNDILLRQLPQRHRPNTLKTVQEKCRIMLKEAIDLTYHCKDIKMDF